MPFDGVPPPVVPPRRKRFILFAVKAPDLKQVIMTSYFEGRLSAADVADLFSAYGLSDD